MIDYITQLGHETSNQFSTEEKNTAIQSLENGKVLLLPQMSFSIDTNEDFILSPQLIDEKSKNISFNIHNGHSKGSTCHDGQLTILNAFMHRYALYAKTLVESLLPHYTSALQLGRTSFRPVEIKSRASSYRKDDTRLHVDAFVASPVNGLRILRVFCNINPESMPRVWHLGEPFDHVVDRFLPRAKKYNPIIAKCLQTLKITKEYRTAYDHYMLQLHDNMKKDMHYQNQVEKIRFDFVPGSTWMVFTDQVSHAALSGQHLLEQTFYVPVDAMEQPALSPLKVLEKACNAKLI